MGNVLKFPKKTSLNSSFGRSGNTGEVYLRNDTNNIRLGFSLDILASYLKSLKAEDIPTYEGMELTDENLKQVIDFLYETGSELKVGRGYLK